MEQYKVTGMSCAACQARVEKAVGGVPGVTSCAVSLLTNSMGVEGTADSKDIIKAVKDAGYGASLKKGENDSAGSETELEDDLKDTETPKLIKRLIWSVGFVLLLMYLSMGHTMWHLPIPDFMMNSPMTVGIAQAVLALIVMIINRRFFTNGFKGLIHAAPNMDTLVALGSSASFIYSTVLLRYQIAAELSGDVILAHDYLHDFYFESAAMILALITVGKTLEARSKGKTTSALKGLMKIAPMTALIEKDGKEISVEVSSLVPGQVFICKAGSRVPVDGEITEGHTSVDESSLTGESIPVDKKSGDTVYAGTLIADGYVRCKATRVGKDTTLSQIIKMVSDAAATKAPIAKIADKVSAVFVPVVMVIAVITTVVWFLMGEEIGFALGRGISVLVISCPCALGLATPVAIMVGNGVGAKNGILFKTSESLEIAGKTDIVVLDKTGTITKGEPVVTDIIPNEKAGITDRELLENAVGIEKMSEHPLARAVVMAGETVGVKGNDFTEVSILPGNGLMAPVAGASPKKNSVDLTNGGKTLKELGADAVSASLKRQLASRDVFVRGGNLNFIKTKARVSEETEATAERLAGEGKTPLFFSKGEVLLGIIAVADTVKDDSAQAVNEMKNLGLVPVMLTGDNERTAKAIAESVGISDVIAGVLPEQKGAVVRALKEKGRVMMVGDGINDAPALTIADTGVAVSNGADVAVDAADVVLMNSRLSDVPALIRLSRRTLTNIKENLFWAFVYNSLGIPLAAGVFINIFGWQLSPMFGAAAMSLSSFCVVSNALRLNLIDIHKTKNDKKRKASVTDLGSAELELKEEKHMTETMKIEGMMCGHCEATVKQTLEAFPEVDSAEVSHEKGTAVVTLNKKIDMKELQRAVEEKGYKVV